MDNMFHSEFVHHKTSIGYVNKAIYMLKSLESNGSRKSALS